MRVSLNWVKKYVDLPKKLDVNQIAYDLTLRTVEVESVENVADKFHDIVVGKVLEVKDHPNADSLRICIVDLGEETVQIVCGGINLYEGEYVVVSKPGAEVYWHGEADLVKIKQTKMRGEDSYGMICTPSEVYLENFFQYEDEREVVDLKGIECNPGDNIADVLCMNDTVIEIDNKSLTNRPDLWGHYGIARELSAIYDVPLKELPKLSIDENLKEYQVEIEEPDKCYRYAGIEIENVSVKESPIWMKASLINAGMRPINAIVDITNYVMMAVGQPTHAFDRTHVVGEKIVVRNAKKNEKLLLLDNNELDLTEDDLVICDTNDAMALAGIRGGKKDSILDTTTGVLLEVANFTAQTIRKTGKRFDEKTDASIRYEKNIDTERVTDGIALSLQLFNELFPESKVVAYKDLYPVKTEREVIDVSQEFLDNRLGKVLDSKTIIKVLTSLGYDVTLKDGIYHVIVPVWRSTGDVSIKDDVMGDIARLLSFESFEAKPLPVNFENAVIQNSVLLTRRIKDYLSSRCGFYEIFTYPWIDEKYINAAKIDITNAIRLATPPAPELSILRSSLVPGMIEAVSKNIRYFDNFKMYEMTEVYENGEYHPSIKEETLPVMKNSLAGCIVGKNAKNIFFELKGVIENMAEYCHMENLTLEQTDKPSWSDVDVWLNIKCGDNVIGSMGLLSVSAMMASKIKRVNVAMFELNADLLVPFASRTNEFKHIPQLPLIEKDLSLIMDESVKWESIKEAIGKKVKELIFIEEYRGNQIPEGKKSIVLRIKLENEDITMTSEDIAKKIDSIVKTLNNRCGATLREE